MRILFGSLVVVAVCFLSSPAGAQPVVELTATEAVERGLEHNVRLAASRAEAGEAQAALRQTRGGRLPTLQATGSATRLWNVPEVEFDFPGLDDTFDFFQIPRTQVFSEVSLEQPLFTGFRLHNQVRAAASRAEAASLLATQDEADVAFEIRAAYAALQQALAVCEAAQSALTAVEEHVRRVRALLAEGAVLRMDLLAAQTRRSEVQLDRLDAENAVQVSRLELNRLIGLPLTTDIVAVDEPTPPAPLALDLLVTEAIETRPQLLAMAEQARALEAEVAASRGAWLPEVGAVGRYVHARPSPVNILQQDEFHGHWEVGLTARWRILDFGRPAATAGAQARLAAARARLADAEQVVAVQVTRRYLEAQRSIEALEVATQHVAEAEESFQVVQAQFAEGAALPAQVLEAEQVLRAAQARLAQAAADVSVAQAAVLNVIGQVW